MSFIKKLLAAIGHFFTGLFNEAEKAYNHLTPEQQEALKNGSGILAVINSMLTAEVADVRAAIQKQFPNINEATLESVLFSGAKTFGLGNFASLDDCIAALQKYLSERQGNAWELISHALASSFSIAFSPETRVAAIISLIEYVYQTFIKGKVAPAS